MVYYHLNLHNQSALHCIVKLLLFKRIPEEIMLRTTFFSLILLTAIFAASISAQTELTITGTVEVDKAGTRSPLAGAKVDLFQVDADGKGKTAISGEGGKFSFNELEAGKVYLLSVSGPGAAPSYLEDIRPGMQGVLVIMASGDGRSVNEIELKTAIATATSQMSAEDKKKQADLQAKRREIAEKNQKIVDSTKIVDAALKAGNAAYQAKDYDLAVIKYDEGFAAESSFVGIAPVLLNNKGAALNARAVDNYNKNVKIVDPAERRTAMNAVKKDLSDSAETHGKSFNILKSAPAEDITDKTAFEVNKQRALFGGREAFRLMVATEQVDDTKGDLAKQIISEYIATETDKVKKDAAMLILADVFRVAGDSTNAIAEYRRVLTSDANNLDAMAGLGISMVNEGYLKEDKTLLQEGANVLQQYATAAPATHKYKDDAQGLIEVLKTQNNIAPQKAPARKRN